jgi:alkylhydroperoxidase family enzyme
VADALKGRPVRALADEELRPLVYLAKWVTKRPARLFPAHVAAVATRRPRGEYLDAVGVMIGFNFITLVANALGVDLDMPRWARHVDAFRRMARRLTILAVRWLVDLRPRPFDGRPAPENLAALDRLCADVSLTLPPALRDLAAAPHLLEVQRELWEALWRRGGPVGVVARDVPRLMTAGLVVLSEVGAAFTSAVADWLRRWGPAGPEDVHSWAKATPPAGGLHGLVARFARAVARHSYQVGPEQIDELRAAGLDDGQILDLVTGIALWNALGRLERLFAGLPGTEESADGPAVAASRAPATARPLAQSV